MTHLSDITRFLALKFTRFFNLDPTQKSYSEVGSTFIDFRFQPFIVHMRELKYKCYPVLH